MHEQKKHKEKTATSGWRMYQTLMLVGGGWNNNSVPRKWCDLIGFDLALKENSKIGSCASEVS